MAQPIIQIRNQLINALVASAASIGITINPNNWVYTPGSLSETDYKLLLLDTVATGIGIQQQLEDLFQSNQEEIIKNCPPQTPPWIQNQFLNIFQWNSIDTQIPTISPTNGFTPSYTTPNEQYKIIDFCSAVFSSSGKVLIRVAANSNGIPADLDTTVGLGALASARSFAFMCQGPGITYTVTSGNSDWLYIVADINFIGAYSPTIRLAIKQAINTFCNNLSTLAFQNNSAAVLKLSALEDAIYHVNGVTDVTLISVAARRDLNSINPSLSTFGTVFQQYLKQNGTDFQKQYSTFAGYIQLENGTSTGTPTPVSYSQLDDQRSAIDSTLNLNLIAQ